MIIIPAILEKDFLSIEKDLTKLSNLKEKYGLDFQVIQIDIVDGKFANNQTYLFQNIDEVEFEQVRLELINFSRYFEIEYHLMCEDQLEYFKKVVDLGAKRVVIHTDNLNNIDIIETIIEIANNRTIELIITSKLNFMEDNKEKITEFLSTYTEIDLQIMGIDNLGLQGQVFNTKCLELVKYFKDIKGLENLKIQIDGGVNQETITEITNSKVDKVVVGSYLMKYDDEEFVRNYKSLRV